MQEHFHTQLFNIKKTFWHMLNSKKKKYFLIFLFFLSRLVCLWLAFYENIFKNKKKNKFLTLIAKFCGYCSHSSGYFNNKLEVLEVF